jgi:hypothetical protein
LTIFEGLVDLVGGGNNEEADEDKGKDGEGGAVEYTEEWYVHNLSGMIALPVFGETRWVGMLSSCLGPRMDGGSAAKLR